MGAPVSGIAIGRHAGTGRMRFMVLFAALLAGACEVGPDYHRPYPIGSSAYKELAGWKRGNPMDAIDRGAWWSIYRDPVLDRLERRISISNQNLKAAQAAYEQAQAVVQQARAGFWPTLTLSAGATRQSFGGGRGASSLAIGGVGGFGGSGGVTQTVYNLQGGASWEPDVWGKIRRTVESEVAAAQASAADVSSAKLSAEATLATDYFDLRAEDALARLLRDTVGQYRRALEITRNQYNAGVAARSDVIQAETQVETVQAQLIAVGLQRAQFEHAIAVLAGEPPSALTTAPATLPSRVPVVPPGVPSTLLERRPDVAAAERSMQQQNALIGVQVAAFFPTVTLSATYGYQGGPVGSLISVANRVWSLGGAASETLFAGGALIAAVVQQRAAYDQSIANYRQTVLTAFQQVEDQLAALRILEQQALAEAVAVRSAEQAVQIALNEYRAGTAAYTAVITAQETALSDEVTLLSIQQSRLVASVALIEALGGGWDTSRLPSKGELQKWNPILPSGPMAQPLRNP
jgi:NodT family efflux transporter outer membrane factor (OMF) lipoprotein